MDNLRVPARIFYNGVKPFEAHKDLARDESGRAIQLAACRAKEIQQAKESSYRRRVYSDDHIHRCDDGTTMTLADFDQLGARWVKDAHDMRVWRDGRTGWYTDNDCGETLIGVVLCFTRHGQGGDDGSGYDQKAKGRVIYMAGTRHSDWDGVTLDLSTTDDPDIAARWADDMARRDAEIYREEDEKFQREQQAEYLRDEIASARKACLKLLRDMRPLRKGMNAFPESVCHALREQVEDYYESIAGYRKELGELI